MAVEHYSANKTATVPAGGPRFVVAAVLRQTDAAKRVFPIFKTRS